MAKQDFPRYSGLRRQASLNLSFCENKRIDETYSKVAKILKKHESSWTNDEKQILQLNPSLVAQFHERLEKRQLLLKRVEEKLDEQSVLEEKCRTLAEALKNSNNVVVYCGAGISTAARIPDYRGSTGLWTLQNKGKEIGNYDFSMTEPTLAHMALYALYKKGIVSHIVSQNCDGLHLRSGIPKKALSEVHGNMYIEVCLNCSLEFLRDFDVTTRSKRYGHKTARLCRTCLEPLTDTIVYSGEESKLLWPLNWTGASKAVARADIILCIGSSLKVLRYYSKLWLKNNSTGLYPKLFIINLQWTSKDNKASLKIHGKCDDVLKLVMSYLNMEIPKYDKRLDPTSIHATKLHSSEIHTVPHAFSNWKIEEMKSDTDDTVLKKQKLSNEENLKKNVSNQSTNIWRPFSENSAAFVVDKINILKDICESASNSDSKSFENIKFKADPDIQQVSKIEHEFDENIFLKKSIKIIKPQEYILDIPTVDGKLFDHIYAGTKIKLEQDNISDNNFILDLSIKDKKCSTETSALIMDNMSDDIFQIKKEAFITIKKEEVSSEVKENITFPKKESDESYIECKRCFESYNTFRCEFYVQHDSPRFYESKRIMCTCCKTLDEVREKDVEKNSQHDKPLSNPGWFGRGFGKKLKKKKK